jgi:hypothetical protein
MSRGARVFVSTLALGALLALAGCANVPPYAAPASGGPAPAPRQAPASNPASAPAAPAPRPMAATADSAPSRDALDVLASIPEPLTPGERVPPPAVAPASEASDDSGSADVPVPAPTPVLGERPLPEVVASTDTTSPPVSPAPRALAEPPPAPRPSAPAVTDTCWRVQIAASAERAKAERYLAAGRSQLLVPLQVESEKGLFKVRTRDCLDGQTADGLRRRALDAGFDGAFRFRGKKP